MDDPGPQRCNLCLGRGVTFAYRERDTRLGVAVVGCARTCSRCSGRTTVPAAARNPARVPRSTDRPRVERAREPLAQAASMFTALLTDRS